MRLKLLCLSLFILALSSCVTIKDAPICALAGRLSAMGGGICAHLRSPATNDLTFKELIDMLEAQPDRECIPLCTVYKLVSGKPVCVDFLNICAENPLPDEVTVKLPARGAAIIMQDSDWNEFKTEAEIACRMLGRRCKYEFKELLRGNL